MYLGKFCYILHIWDLLLVCRCAICVILVQAFRPTFAILLPRCCCSFRATIFVVLKQTWIWSCFPKDDWSGWFPERWPLWYPPAAKVTQRPHMTNANPRCSLVDFGGNSNTVQTSPSLTFASLSTVHLDFHAPLTSLVSLRFSICHLIVL
jgi:hypothetical protein